MTPPILKRFLIACEHHKLLGLFIFLLSLGISGIVALQPAPPTPETTYKASGQLSYSNPPPLFTSTGEQLQQAGRQINVDILLGPTTQERIKKQLAIDNSQLKQIIEQKLKINVPEEEQNTLITLNYTNADTPEEAVRVLDVFMQEMVEQSRLLNSSQLSSRVNTLKKRLQEVQKELANAQEGLYRFLSKDGTDLLAVQDGTLFSGITGSQQQQRQLKLILDEIDGQINSIVEQLGLNPQEAYTAAALSADPILTNLRSQILEIENQLKLNQKDLRPEHPTMVGLRKQQQTVEQQFQERATEVLGGDGTYRPLPSQLRQDSSLDPARQQLANTLVTLQTQKDGILRQLNSVANNEKELRQQYEQFPEQQLEQTRLVQEVDTKKALYQTILTALVDAQSAEAETTSSFAIAQAPVVQEVVPTTSIATNRLLILGAGAGIGIAAALGIIFLLATLDDRLYTAKEIRDLLGEREVSILGKIPYVVCFDSEGRQTPILTDIDSGYLGFYEKIRSNLRRFASQAAKIILVTSVSGDEGKSVTAYNLAIASAHAGKRTLILEADLRSPSNANLIEVESDPEAGNEPLNYYANRNDAIRLVPAIANLYIVPSPGPLRQAPAVIESNEFRRLIEDARGRFDVVIVDSPSLSRYNDALLIESLTDGILLVTRPEISQGSMLGETIDQFAETDIPLIGAVINDLTQKEPVPDLQSQDLLKKQSHSLDNQLGSQI